MPDELRNALDRCGELYAQGRYADALPHAKEALRLGEGEFGPEHAETADLLNNLARLYDNQGRYTEAEPLYRRALAIVEKSLGPDHPEFGEILDNLAGLSSPRAATQKPSRSTGVR